MTRPATSETSPATRPTARIASIRYNPANRAFDALVTIQAEEAEMTYPVSLRAPLDMEYEEVARAVTELAQRRHERRKAGDNSGRLCSRRRWPQPRQEDDATLEHVPGDIRRATARFWTRLLNTAA